MRRTTMVVVLAVTLLGAACGDSSVSTTPATTATAATSAAPISSAPGTAAPTTTSGVPIEVTSEAGTVSLESAAQRIAVLSATHVEMFFAIGAGDQLIAGDLFSDYPPEAAQLPRLDSFNLSVESVIDLDPDLVVLTFDPGDAVAAFEAVGIPTLLFSPAPTLDAAYEQMQVLGAVSGHTDEAGALV